MGGTFSNAAGIFNLNGKSWTLTSGGANFTNPGTIELQGGEAITGLTQDSTEGTWIYAGPNTGSAASFTLYGVGSTSYFNLVIASTDNKDSFGLGML